MTDTTPPPPTTPPGPPSSQPDPDAPSLYGTPYDRVATVRFFGFSLGVRPGTFKLNALGDEYRFITSSSDEGLDGHTEGGRLDYIIGATDGQSRHMRPAPTEPEMADQDAARARQIERAWAEWRAANPTAPPPKPNTLREWAKAHAYSLGGKQTRITAQIQAIIESHSAPPPAPNGATPAATTSPVAERLRAWRRSTGVGEFLTISAEEIKAVVHGEVTTREGLAEVMDPTRFERNADAILAAINGE